MKVLLFFLKIISLSQFAQIKYYTQHWMDESFTSFFKNFTVHSATGYSNLVMNHGIFLGNLNSPKITILGDFTHNKIYIQRPTKFEVLVVKIEKKYYF